MKMEFPRFNGDEPLVWLDQPTQFFEYQQTGEGQKVTLAAFYLRGRSQPVVEMAEERLFRGWAARHLGNF
jgi:hypothetical protein